MKWHDLSLCKGKKIRKHGLNNYFQTIWKPFPSFIYVGVCISIISIRVALQCLLVMYFDCTLVAVVIIYLIVSISFVHKQTSLL